MMIAILSFLITQIISINKCTFHNNLALAQDDLKFENIKDNSRPTFLRLLAPKASPSFGLNEQWKAVSKIYPQINFITVDCSKNKYICTKYNQSVSRVLYSLILPKKTNNYNEVNIEEDDISQDFSKFLMSTIHNYTHLYPLLPSLNAFTNANKANYYNNNNNNDHILVFYNSHCSEQESLLNHWLKLANEEHNYQIKFLDCFEHNSKCISLYSEYDNSRFYSLFYSHKTGNYQILDPTTNISKENPFYIDQIGSQKNSINSKSSNFILETNESFSGTFGQDLTYTYDNGTLKISGNGSMEDFDNETVVPWKPFRSSIKNIIIEEGVNSIGSYSFYKCTSLTSISIANSVKTIGSYSFAQCQKLDITEIPNQITSIGKFAFTSCYYLSQIMIHDQVTSIGEEAFSHCLSLKSITIPQSVTSIPKHLFDFSRNLCNITMSDDVTEIGEGAFQQCFVLKSFTIPKGVTSISNYLFYSCESLKEIIIHENVSSVGNSAFKLCESLEYIELPNKIKQFSYYLFENCSSLSTIVFPNDLSYIDMKAFAYCTSLKFLKIPDSVKGIDQCAFLCCINLQSINIPEKMEVITAKTFAQCYSLNSIVFGNNITTIRKNAFHNCGLTSIILPSKTQIIETGAFSNCNNLTWVMLEGNISNIGSDAFAYCPELSTVYYAGLNAPQFVDEPFKSCPKITEIYVRSGYTGDTFCGMTTYPNLITNPCGMYLNCAYTYIKKTLFIYGEGAMKLNTNQSWPWINSAGDIVNIIIQNGVESIAERAFQNMPLLESIYISKTVTKIGRASFYNSPINTIQIDPLNKNLRAIDDVIYSKAGDRIIYYPSGKTGNVTFIIPSCVKTIVDYAFYGTTNIGILAFAGISINVNGRNEFSGIKTVLVPKNYKSNGFGVLSVKKELIVGSLGSQIDWILKLYNDTLIVTGFGNMGNFTSSDQPISNQYLPLFSKVRILKGVEIISDYTFNNCTNIVSIDIPQSVPSIGKRAFNLCTSLQTLNVSSNNEYLKSIDGVVFSKDERKLLSYPIGRNERTYVIPENTITIYDYAFYASSLTLITIMNNVLNIGSYAFAECHNLTKVIILVDIIKSLGMNAFSNCVNLRNVLFTGKYIEEFYDNSFGNCNELQQVYVSQDYSYSKFGNINCLECLEHGFDTPNIKWIYKTGSNELTICGYGKMANLTTAPWKYLSRTVKYAFIENGIESIGENAFANYNKLEQISIEESVSHIYCNFGDCTSLQSINVNENSHSFISINGALFSKDRSKIICVPSFYNETHMILPSKVTEIGSYAFANCQIIDSLLLGAQITNIGYRAFYNFYSLTRLFYLGEGEPRVKGTGVIANTNKLNETWVTSQYRHTTFLGKTVNHIMNREIYGINILGITEFLPDTIIITGYGTMDEFTESNHPTFSCTTVIMEGNIRSIGSYCFYKLENLTSILIPDTVTEISQRAFYSCKSLKSLYLPNSIKDIPIHCFEDCTSLEEIHLPEYLEEIHFASFRSCKSLIKIEIPFNVTKIGDYCFSGCSSLTEIVLPINLQKIGKEGFLNCTLLTHVILPPKLQSIGDGAFQNVCSLTQIDFNTNLQSIGNKAFQNCYLLGQVDFPLSLESIGSSAFQNCSSLTEIDLPINLRSIGDLCFQNCSSLQKIHLPDNLTSIGYRFCSDNPKLKEIYMSENCTNFKLINNIIYSKNITKLVYYFEYKENSSFEVPESVVIIDKYAFYNCINLVSIKLPDNLEAINEGSFYNCKKLESIIIPEKVNNISIKCFYKCENLRTISIPDNISSIGESAFANCSSLESIKLDEKLTIINPYTFIGCFSLKSIIIPNGVKYIMGNAFSDCINLKSVSFGTKLKSISDCAFYNCSIQSLIIPKETTSFGIMIFWYNKNLSCVNYLGYRDSLSYNNIFEYCPKLISIKVPYNFNSKKFSKHQIEKCIFRGEMDNGINWLFDNITNTLTLFGYNDIKINQSKEYPWEIYRPIIENIVITHGVKSIDENIFKEHNLISIYIPESMTTIENKAFSACCNLSTIIINEYNENYMSVENVIFSKDASKLIFYAPKNNISYYIIPESVTVIDENAFYLENNLNNLAFLGEQMPQIERNSLNGCVNVNKVHVSSNYANNNFGSFDVVKDLTVGKCGDNVNYILNLIEGTLVISGIGDMNYSSNTTNPPWFSYLSSFSKVEITDGINRIGDFSFINCMNIISISIPQTVSSIGKGVFYSCNSLKAISVKINNDRYKSKDGVLYGIEEQILICYPTGKDEESFSISENVLIIDEYAFCFSSLKSLFYTHITWDFEDYSLDIRDNAFYNCQNLTSITVAYMINEIGQNAFYNCPKLNIFEYTKNEVNTIHENSFSGCNELDTIYVSNDYKSDNFGSFKVNKILILDNIKYNGDWISNEKTRTMRIYGSGYLRNYSNGDDQPWANYRENIETFIIEEGITEIGSSTFTSFNDLKTIILPKSITKIHAVGMANMKKIETITIPENVEYIGPGAFVNNPLLEVKIDKNNRNYYLRDKVLFTKDNTTLVFYPIPLNNEYYRVPDNVTTIYNYSFYKNKVKYIIISEQVNTIGNYAFCLCSNLTYFSYTGKKLSVGEYAFDNCPFTDILVRSGIYNGYSKLNGKGTSKTLSLGCAGPNLIYVSSLDFLIIYGSGEMYNYNSSSLYAWKNTVSLIILEPGLTSIGDYAFHKLKNIKSIILPETVTSIGHYAFANCTELNEITLSENIISIGNYSFNSTKISGSFSLPINLISIGAYAFNSCSLVESFYIPEKVNEIGELAFSNCSKCISFNVSEYNNYYKSIDGILYAKNESSLILFAYPIRIANKTFIVPDNVIEIGNNAFRNCLYLESIDLGKNTKIIGNYSFYRSNIKNATIQNNTLIISDRAFGKCNYLQSVEIGSGITYVGSYSFNSCKNLIYVSYNGLRNPAHGIHVFTGSYGLKKVRVPAYYENWEFCDKSVEHEKVITPTIVHTETPTIVDTEAPTKVIYTEISDTNQNTESIIDSENNDNDENSKDISSSNDLNDDNTNKIDMSSSLQNQQSNVESKTESTIIYIPTPEATPVPKPDNVIIVDIPDDMNEKELDEKLTEEFEKINISDDKVIALNTSKISFNSNLSSTQYITTIGNNAEIDFKGGNLNLILPNSGSVSVKLNNEENKLSIKGEGELNLNSKSDSIKINSNSHINGPVKIVVPNNVDTLMMDSIELDKESSISVKTKDNEKIINIIVNNVTTVNNSNPTISNMTILDSITIVQSTTINIDDVTLDNATIYFDIYDYGMKDENWKPIIKGNLNNAPSQIILNKVSNEQNDKPEAGSEFTLITGLFEENMCNAWLEKIEFGNSGFSIKNCVDNNMLAKENERIVIKSPGSNDNNNKKNLSGGQIAGIVIGCIAGVAIIVVIVIIIIKKRKPNENSESQDSFNNVENDL